MKLKNVEINPGRLCNNKCIFCMSGEERDDHEPWADPARMKAEIKLRFEEGARSLGFLGGEPSAYPHIEECVRYAKRLGYVRIALCTNGVRLANRGFLEKLLDAGLSRVTVSLHSHLSRIEEFLVGVPGILDKKLSAIGNLVESERAGRFPHGVSLNPVLCRPNAPHIEAFARFFKSRGIRDIRFNYIWPESRVQNDKSVVPEYKDVVPYMLNLMLKNERELGMTISFGAVPFCVLPPSVHDNWPLMRKYFWEEGLDLPTDVSFLKHSPLQQDRHRQPGIDLPGDGGVERFNWHARGRGDYRGKVEACRGCRFDSTCMGIYRSYLALYGEGGFGLRETVEKVPVP